MTTELRLALAACGLSQRQAAEFLGVRLDSVERALRGRDRTPPGWLAELRRLHARQRQAAQQAYAIWQQHQPDQLELSIASDDAEAQAPPLGWPCQAAQLAAYRMLWEMLPPDVRIILVPRGTSVATAAAADRHDAAP